MNNRNIIKETDVTCELSQQIFLDPVKVPSTYEKQADGTIVVKFYVTAERQMIENWIRTKGNNPFTRKPLKISELIPDTAMKEKVDTYLKANPDKKDSQYVLELPSASNQSTSASQTSRASSPTADDLLAMANQGSTSNVYPPQPSQLSMFRPQPRTPSDRVLRGSVSSEQEEADIHLIRDLEVDPAVEELNLNPHQILALIDLYKYGLRGNHLRSWQPAGTGAAEIFGPRHHQALVHLISNLHIAPITAVQKINGLNAYQVLALEELRMRPRNIFAEHRPTLEAVAHLLEKYDGETRSQVLSGPEC